IIGLANLTVKVNTKYIKEMLNNLDIQSNVMMNYWIAGILIFNFMLKHISMSYHQGPDRLSR
ncbi:hypothetical protein F5I97DRAFT_1788169, partial [Phlebopus sp. FC_14]